MSPSDWPAWAGLLGVVGTVLTTAIAVSGWRRSQSRLGKLERLSAAADRDWNIWRNLPLFHKSKAQVRALANSTLQEYLTEAAKPPARPTKTDKWSWWLYSTALSLMAVAVGWALLRNQATDFALWEAWLIVALIPIGLLLAIAGVVVEAVALRVKRGAEGKEEQLSGTGNA